MTKRQSKLSRKRLFIPKATGGMVIILLAILLSSAVMPGTKSTSSIYTSNQKAASSDTPLLTGTKPIPFIHTSDLVHPTWDPDDQVDLGCLYALPEFDLKAIIIDNHIDNSKMHMYEPAFSLISQLNWLTGKAVPAAVGPNTKLLSPSDDGSH